MSRPRVGCGTGCGCAGIGCSVPLLIGLVALVTGLTIRKGRK